MSYVRESHLLEIDSLEFSYGDRLLFKEFSWSSARRISVLRGPSGCGKTTLLKLILGILSPAAAAISAPSPKRMILQDDSLAPWLSGMRNVELFLRVTPEAVRAHPMFSLVERFIERPIYQLSFGQRRLVELLRIFFPQHGLLLLDEPLNFLDILHRKRVLSFLDDQLSRQVRVVMTTHLTDEFTLREADHYEFRGEPPYSELRQVNPSSHAVEA